jgi:2-oxoglutarate dehydrogenase E1 component
VLDDVALAGDPVAGVTLDRERVRRLLFCSGKIYYSLLAERRERNRDDVAIIRVEELYPFPGKELEAIVAAYPEAKQTFWVQEEPWNMGGWHVMYRRIRRLLPEDRTIAYVGRAEAASPATGNYKVHLAEERELLNDAFAR